MNAGVLRVELYEQGVALSVADGRLKYSAPEGALTPALLQEMKLHKPELLEILEAEAAYNGLNDRIFELADAAAANDLYGAHDEAARQRAEANALVQGPYAEAHERYMELVGEYRAEVPELAEVG